jgi:hypothetical protein
VELALTGRASDVAGRETIGRESDLISLAPPGEGLFAEVVLGDSTARYECKRTKTGTSRAKHTTPLSEQEIEHVFPLRGVMAPLTGNPESLRKFLLGRATGAVTVKDVEALIPASLLDRYRHTLQACPSTLGATDQVVVALELAKANAREATARAKAAHAMALSTAQGLAARPTVVQVAAATERLQKAKTALEDVIGTASSSRATQGARANLAGARAQIEGLERTRVSERERVAQVEKSLEGIVAEARALPAPPAPSPSLTVIVNAMQATVDAPDCLVCGATLSPGGVRARLDLVHTVTRRDNELRTAHNALEARWHAAQQAHRGGVNAIIQIEAQLDLVRKLAASLEQIVGQEGPAKLALVIGPEQIEAARALVAGAEQEVMVLSTASASWRGAESANEAKLAAEVDGASWAQLADACGDAVKKLLDENVKAFVEKVQARLPEAWKFGIQLHDGAREVARLGIERGGQLQTALSGGEWAVVTAAIADACVDEGGGEGDALTIIVPEDRGVDPAGLLANLRAFTACRSQVIVTSTVRLPGEVPGWTVIDTQRGEHLGGHHVGARADNGLDQLG